MEAEKGSKRRDFLRGLENEMQAKWADEKIYESNAPESFDPTGSDIDAKNAEKFFTTFPYPYMNGMLHLGHGYSMSKNEFAARFNRMQGKNTLFPFSFHCTGMPIAASAIKLKQQLDDPSLVEALKARDPPVKPQADILREMGVAEEEIPEFVNSEKWLKYFPEYAQRDLQAFGLGADWRRSFITTSINAYYDQFIKWQFTKLKEKNKITFGRRPAIFSVADQQVCADHDRSEGEGVTPQEYTLIKIKVLEFADSIAEFKDKNVFMVAATLRPETMYGQTNCFVLPEGEYGVYAMPNDEYFICTERSMINMAHQDMTKDFAKFE